MAIRTVDYTAAYYMATVSVTTTVDLTTHSSGPTLITGSTTTLLGHPCRSIICTNGGTGSSLRVERMDGTKVTISTNAQTGQEFPVQAKKLLPTTNGAWLILW
jgi:hypothetical protein